MAELLKDDVQVLGIAPPISSPTVVYDDVRLPNMSFPRPSPSFGGGWWSGVEKAADQEVDQVKPTFETGHERGFQRSTDFIPVVAAAGTYKTVAPQGGVNNDIPSGSGVAAFTEHDICKSKSDSDQVRSDEVTAIAALRKNVQVTVLSRSNKCLQSELHTAINTSSTTSTSTSRLQRLHSDSSNNHDNSACSGCDRCILLDDNLKELYKENSSLRIRVKAVDTISESLRKAKDELTLAIQKNVKLDKAVGNLQSRLHRVGCDTSVDLAEDEIFIPGHDRTFVNSLISENGRLQKELKERNLSGEARTRLCYEKQKDAEKEQQLHDLREQLKIKRTRILELENIVAVQSSKDAEKSLILELHDGQHRTAEELKEFKTLCCALTSETKRLQDASDAAHNKCQKVLKELSEWKDKAEALESKFTVESTQKMSSDRESRLSTAVRLKISGEQIKQLEKENSRLTDQLREVIGMNTRWQRYNEQRETYVLKLTKTNQHQQSKITVLEQQQRDLEQTINGLNTMLQNLGDGKKKNTDAFVMSLEQQLVQREDQVGDLRDEVAKLKMCLHSSETERGMAQRLEDKEMIDTLKEQVKVYKEDFDQERKDRERLQGNNDILRHRLQEAKKMYTPINDVQTARYAVYDQPRRIVPRGISRPAYQGYFEDSLLPSGVVTDGADERDKSTGKDDIDSDVEKLQCPRCSSGFAVTDHSIFMRHVGICLDQ